MDSNDSDEHDVSIVTVEMNELGWVKSVISTRYKELGHPDCTLSLFLTLDFTGPERLSFTLPVSRLTTYVAFPFL